VAASKGSLKGRVGRYRQVKLSVIGRRSREARQQHAIFYPSLYDTLRRNDEGLVRFCSRHRSLSAYLLSRAPLTLQYSWCIRGRRVVSGQNRWSAKHIANHDNHSWCRLLFLVRGDLWDVPSCGQGLAEMEWDFEVGEGGRGTCSQHRNRKSVSERRPCQLLSGKFGLEGQQTRIGVTAERRFLLRLSLVIDYSGK
jgi:hypothetical protein